MSSTLVTRTHVLAVLLMTACSRAGSGPGAIAAGEDAGGGERIWGRVTILGERSKGVEVLLLDRNAKVLGFSTTDSAGSYVVAAPRGYANGWLLFRAYDPVIAIQAREVDTAPANVDLEIAESDTEILQGRISVPGGIRPDWVEVSLTPRQIPDVPQVLAKAILADGSSRSMKATYVTRKQTGMDFLFRVVPGVYDLRVDRWVDAPDGAELPIPNLTAQAVLATDGGPVTPRTRGFLIDMFQSRQVLVTMAVSHVR
jgi:hypothetical protein